jgi:hypothetical protein
MYVLTAGKYKLALKDYEGVFRARPNDKDAKLKFTECKKIVQQIAFQKGTPLKTFSLLNLLRVS